MRPDTAHGRFSHWVRETPDADAVVSGEDRLSYRSLDEESNRVADLLLDAGVPPGRPVALLMERSATLFAAVLGVLKAGACYLPLHDAYPVERMARVLELAGDPVVLADPVSAAAHTLPGVEPLIVEARRGSVSGTPAAVPSVGARPETSPESPAYIMFTSGSSGEPKGVVVSHANVLDLVSDPCWDSGHHRRVLMVAPHAFSVSAYEMLVPLLRGGTVVTAPTGPVGVSELSRLIREHEISGMHVTAGLFRVLAEEDPGCLSGLHEVLTGGDTVSSDAVRNVMLACPDLVVRTTYGATETTLFTVSAPVASPPAPGSRLPVGLPMAGVGAHVLDDALRPVPDGVQGELHLDGPRLALGYLNRPESTAERFIESADGSGTRTYRTGDLVRRGSDGMIEVVGRADQQVKIRGFRVEPAEVEAVLSRMPEVAHATVVPQDFPPGGTGLAAYVVPASGRVVDLTEARDLVRRLLPEYMVPSAFAVMSVLPLTPNGKVDRSVLPPLTTDREVERSEPRSSTERLICGLFSEVLETTPVGPEDDFFMLGGQSLLATRLLHRVEGETGVALRVVDLLDASTARGLASVVDRHKAEEHA